MYSTANVRPLNTFAAQPSCGCAAPAVLVASPAFAIAPLPRSLTPFAPTAAWSSNLFAAAPAGADGANTGQAAAYAMTPWETLASGAAVAGTALGAYHGYKRTESLGWAIGWALLGGLFPFITIPVAFAQGFGKSEPAFRRVRG